MSTAAIAEPGLKPMRVKVIATQIVYGKDLLRHYPRSHGHKDAGREFIIDAQDFSLRCMRLSPTSKFTFEQVMAYQRAWRERNPAPESDMELERKGKFREPYIKPVDRGLVEEGEPEVGAESFSTLQKKAEQMRPMERTVEAVDAHRKRQKPEQEVS